MCLCFGAWVFLLLRGPKGYLPETNFGAQRVLYAYFLSYVYTYSLLKYIYIFNIYILRLDVDAVKSKSQVLQWHETGSVFLVIEPSRSTTNDANSFYVCSMG